MTLVRPVRGSVREQKESPDWLARLLALGRPLVMGVLHVTPDSFSDGGCFLDPAAALEQASRMIAEGADILDIGAESTRPYGGAVAVPSEEEIRRLGPVVPAAVAMGGPVSIDILADISAFFSRSLEIARRAGIAREKIVLDPGIGFGKTAEQSLTAIARIGELKSFGFPLLVGASRKRFIDKVSPASADQRLGGSIAAHVLAVLGGAAIIRTHDVAETVQALRVAAAIRSAG